MYKAEVLGMNDSRIHRNMKIARDDNTVNLILRIEKGIYTQKIAAKFQKWMKTRNYILNKITITHLRYFDAPLISINV